MTDWNAIITQAEECLANKQYHEASKLIEQYCSSNNKNKKLIKRARAVVVQIYETYQTALEDSLKEEGDNETD